MLNVWMLTEFFMLGDTLLPVAALYGPNGPSGPITFQQGYTTPEMPPESRSIGTIVEVQSTSTNGGGPIAFNSNVTVGNCIVVAIAWNFTSGSSIPTVSDNKSNVYVLAGSTKTSGGIIDAGVTLYYAKNVAAGATTITVNTNTDTADGIAIYEFSGVDQQAPLDIAGTQNDVDPATSSTASIATTADGSLFLGIGTNIATGTTVSNPMVADSGCTAITGSSAGTITLVQSTNTAVNTTSTTASFTNPTVAGNLIVALITGTGTGSFNPTVSDGAGNSYTLTATGASSITPLTAEVAYCVAAGSTSSVAFNTSASGINMRHVILMEFSGVSAIDVVGSSPLTTTADNDLVISFGFQTSGATPGAPSGFTNIFSGNAAPGTNDNYEVGYNADIGLAGSHTFTESSSASSIFFAFKPASAVNWISQYKIAGDAGAESIVFNDGAVTSNFAEAYVALRPTQARVLASVETNPANIALAETDPRVQVAGTIWDKPIPAVLAHYSADLDGAVTYQSMGQVLSRLAQAVSGFDIDL